MLGAIIGNMLLAIFMHKIGWRQSYAWAALFALFLAILAWICIRDYPDHYQIKAKSKLTLHKVIANVKLLSREPQIWLQSMYIALMYETITVFCGLWANPFLRRAFDLNLEQATMSCSLVLVGIGIGSPISGILCDTDHKKAKCIKVCAVAMFVLMCAILYIPILPIWLINILMFTLGVSGSSLILCFAIVSDIAPEGAKSTSVGLTNTLSLSSAVILQPIIGWILNMLSHKATTEGLELYSANNFRIALSILPVMIFLAFIVAIYIDREFKKAVKKRAMSK